MLRILLIWIQKKKHWWKQYCGSGTICSVSGISERSEAGPISKNLFFTSKKKCQCYVPGFLTFVRYLYTYFSSKYHFKKFSSFDPDSSSGLIAEKNTDFLGVKFKAIQATAVNLVRREVARWE
jgi:hypothetical protein